MILHAIELSGVGRFRDRVSVGPFLPGINVIAAPNESGKTTLIRAAARALFDRHGTRGDELKSLQPAGTELAPHVAVEFETRAGRYRIEKTFLIAPRSRLLEWQQGHWQPLAEGDAADQRMQQLLQSSLPGKGATKPEHWGFLGYLWARQGELATWPVLDQNPTAQQLRAKLARIELDPLVERLFARLESEADGQLTAKGQPKLSSALARAEEELAQLDATLSQLQQSRADLEAASRQFRESETAVGQLERELEERELAAAQLREATLAAERIRGDLQLREQELAAAQTALAAVLRDIDRFQQLQRDGSAARAEAQSAADAAQSARARAESMRLQIEQATRTRMQLESTLASERARLQRTQSHLRLRTLQQEADRASQLLHDATQTAAELAALKQRLSETPSITERTLDRLQSMGDSIRLLQSRLEVVGLQVRLSPHKQSEVKHITDTASESMVIPAGTSQTLRATESLEIDLADWGRIQVQSGSAEAQATAKQLQEARNALSSALTDAGVASVEAARVAFNNRLVLEAQLKTVQATLTARLAGQATLDAAQAAVTTAIRKQEALKASLELSPEELGMSLPDLEALEATLQARVPAAESTLKASAEAVETLQASERNGVQSIATAERAIAEGNLRMARIDVEIVALQAKYPAGLEDARTQLQLTFAQAEGRLQATKAHLPPDFQALPERNRRMAAALQQLRNELQVRRAERDKTRGRMEVLGGMGLYSRETELQERRADAAETLELTRRKAWAARIASDLIAFRKQSATRAVLGPLEDRLSQAFADVSGVLDRRVFLDENLAVAGIGRSRDALHPFELLSQGAKEQLLLCLRIAVAEELATNEPQVLLLDDVLTHTDALRHDRILDVLNQVATRIQIVILTCHPGRYRGVGNPLAPQG